MLSEMIYKYRKDHFWGDVVRVSLLLSPVTILAIQQMEIIEESVPDAGNHSGGNKLNHYRTVVELTGKNHIRLAL